jgi:hypothetical protein
MRLLCWQSDFKAVVSTGIIWVKNWWKKLRKRYPHLKPRRSPWDTSYDLHVNVASGVWADVSTNSITTYVCYLRGQHADGILFF